MVAAVRTQEGVARRNVTRDGRRMDVTGAAGRALRPVKAETGANANMSVFVLRKRTEERMEKSRSGLKGVARINKAHKS